MTYSRAGLGQAEKNVTQTHWPLDWAQFLNLTQPMDLQIQIGLGLGLVIG